MTTLTPEKLASVRAAAARAADGWSPTSSSWAALEHCAEASPVAVMAMCERIRELEATTSWHMSAHRVTCSERDAAQTVLELERAQVAKLREGARKLEAERDGMAKALELARAEVAEAAVFRAQARDEAVAAYRTLAESIQVSGQLRERVSGLRKALLAAADRAAATDDPGWARRLDEAAGEP